MILAKYLNSSRGATLIESIVAIALAGVIVTAVVSMAVSAIYTSTLAKSRTNATRFAEEAMEVTRSTRDRLSWDNFWDTYVDEPAWGVAANLTLVATANYTIPSPPCTNPCPFERQVLITDASGNGSDDVENDSRTQVAVTVSWVDRGVTQEVELVSYLTKWFVD